MKTSLMPIITLENCIKITEDTEKHNQPFVFLASISTVQTYYYGTYLILLHGSLTHWCYQYGPMILGHQV